MILENFSLRLREGNTDNTRTWSAKYESVTHRACLGKYVYTFCIYMYIMDLK